jgi:hypothetical protein
MWRWMGGDVGQHHKQLRQPGSVHQSQDLIVRQICSYVLKQGVYCFRHVLLLLLLVLLLMVAGVLLLRL